MKVTLTVLTGFRAGHSASFDKDLVALGRHAASDLQLDPDKDLDVSTRHATIVRQGALHLLRDLGSTNGTLVNGVRITGERPLAEGDVIQLGPRGPKLEVHFSADPGIAATRPSRAAGGPSGVDAAHPAGATQRIRVEVERQTRGLRRATVMLLVLLAAVTSAYFWQQRESERRLEQERQALLSQVDTLMRQLGSMTVNVESMRQTLASAQAETSRLRDQIGAGTDPSTLAGLRAQLSAAVARQRQIRSAAELDAAAISAANQDAVALVLVQFPDGSGFTGTAFAVRSDREGGYLVTNRHVVTDSSGNRPAKIGVVFNGSRQNFRAELVASTPNDSQDVALLRVAIRGGVPVVKGLSERVPTVGEPVAIIGFPLGLDLEGGGDWTKTGVSATLTIGTTSRLLPDVLQFDSYGAQGASGSPIFDRGGLVIGILYGGEKESGGRIVYGAPARYAAALLREIR